MSKYPPIQIVNDQDQPTGEADMMEAYKQGFIHRIVFVIVEDENGRVLLQKRGPNVVNHPHSWDISVGGHVDANESYEVAAHREIKEELGLESLELAEVDYVYKEVEANKRQLKRFNKLYKISVPSDIAIKFNPEEITETRWFDATDISELVINAPDKIAHGLNLCIERRLINVGS